MFRDMAELGGIVFGRLIIVKKHPEVSVEISTEADSNDTHTPKRIPAPAHLPGLGYCGCDGFAQEN